MIKIINGGMLSTIQDAGRFGVMKHGFTQSGAMDSRSMKIANSLCGNKPDAPVIEMTMMGISAVFTDEHYFCISGGDFSPKLNNVPIKNNCVYKAVSGDMLTTSVAKSGMRCYLAVSGGFEVPLVMGSASTNIKLGFGGFEGRKLKKDDMLKTGSDFRNVKENNSVESETYDRNVTIRVIPGPQDDMFTDTDKKLFFGQHYCVTPYLDRMGIRLNGIALKGKDGLDIISDGITFGSVQIARSGMPIILMADHQTTGGYAKIATVISADLPKLAQVRTNDIIRFQPVSVKCAEKLIKKENKFIDKISVR